MAAFSKRKAQLLLPHAFLTRRKWKKREGGAEAVYSFGKWNSARHYILFGLSLFILGVATERRASAWAAYYICWQSAPFVTPSISLAPFVRQEAANKSVHESNCTRLAGGTLLYIKCVEHLLHQTQRRRTRALERMDLRKSDGIMCIPPEMLCSWWKKNTAWFCTHGINGNIYMNNF